MGSSSSGETHTVLSKQFRPYGRRWYKARAARPLMVRHVKVCQLRLLSVVTCLVKIAIPRRDIVSVYAHSYMLRYASTSDQNSNPLCLGILPHQLGPLNKESIRQM